MSLKQIANVRMGPASLVWNGVDLGHTLDGIDIEIERNYQDLNVDKYGDSPVDTAVTGHKATVTFRSAEPIVELIQRINPEGLNQIGTSGSKAGIGTDAGTLLRQFSAQLTIHPNANGANDFTEDVVFYKTVNTNNIVLNYKVKDQRVVECKFVAFVDESQPSGRRLGHIGLTLIS